MEPHCKFSNYTGWGIPLCLASQHADKMKSMQQVCIVSVLEVCSPLLALIAIDKGHHKFLSNFITPLLALIATDKGHHKFLSYFIFNFECKNFYRFTRFIMAWYSHYGHEFWQTNCCMATCSGNTDCCKKKKSCLCCTVNFLNIRTPKIFVVITLKFEQCGSTIE